MLGHMLIAGMTFVRLTFLVTRSISIVVNRNIKHPIIPQPISNTTITSINEYGLYISFELVSIY